jgi:hypothetical protein
MRRLSINHRVQTAYNTLLADQKPFDVVDMFEKSAIKLSLDVLVNLEKRIEVFPTSP